MYQKIMLIKVGWCETYNGDKPIVVHLAGGCER